MKSVSEEVSKPNPLFDSPSLIRLFSPDHQLETKLMSVVLSNHPHHEFLVDLDEKCGFITAADLAAIISEFKFSFEKKSDTSFENLTPELRSFPIDIVEGWQSPQISATRINVMNCSVEENGQIRVQTRSNSEMLVVTTPTSTGVVGTFHQEEAGVSVDHRRFNQSSAVDRRHIQENLIPPDQKLCVVIHRSYLS